MSSSIPSFRVRVIVSLTSNMNLTNQINNPTSISWVIQTQLQIFVVGNSAPFISQLFLHCPPLHCWQRPTDFLPDIFMYWNIDFNEPQLSDYHCWWFQRPQQRLAIPLTGQSDHERWSRGFRHNQKPMSRGLPPHTHSGSSWPPHMHSWP